MYNLPDDTKNNSIRIGKRDYMSRKIYKTEDTNYSIRRTFGTRSVTELIAQALENRCNSPLVLTTCDGSSYNIFGSVEEVTDENR